MNKNHAIGAEKYGIPERLFWSTADLRFIQFILPVHFRSSELPINTSKRDISIR